MFWGNFAADSHATRPVPRRRPVDAGRAFAAASGLDLGILHGVRPRPRRRTARVTGAAPDQLGERLREVDRDHAFWQLAPDGRTIERLYDPGEEPLDVQKNKE